MPDYENLPPSVFKAAWLELAKCLGERMQQDELDLMDSVLQGVGLDMGSRPKPHINFILTKSCTNLNLPQDEKQILRQFPHLASKEADNKEMPSEI